MSRTGDRLQVGTDTTRSPHSNLIFRKGPVKAEIAGEWMGPAGGRKLRGFYGRDADGHWRGQLEDIGHVTMDAGVSPYCYIRVLDDEVITLDSAEDMAGEMNEAYLRAVVNDRRVYEDTNYYQLVRSWLSEMLEAKREARLNLEAGMAALGIRRSA